MDEGCIPADFRCQRYSVRSSRDSFRGSFDELVEEFQEMNEIDPVIDERPRRHAAIDAQVLQESLQKSSLAFGSSGRVLCGLSAWEPPFPWLL